MAASWSRRRSSAALAPPWSARVTVVTPPCTSAGIATPACPWWTLVLPWRYQKPCLFLIVFSLLTSHAPVAVASSLVCLFLCAVLFSTGKGPLIQCPLSYFSSHVCVLFSLPPCVSPSSICLFVHVHLCPSTLTLLEATNSPSSELTRPLGSPQGATSLSVVCWYRTHSLSFSDTCWNREVLQPALQNTMKLLINRENYIYISLWVFIYDVKYGSTNYVKLISIN